MQNSIDSTLHLEQLEVDQLLLEEKIAALNYEVMELGKKVFKNTRTRISVAAKVHASRGSAKADKPGFPAADDRMLYEEDDDDNVNKDALGQRLKDLCCVLS